MQVLVKYSHCNMNKISMLILRKGILMKFWKIGRILMSRVEEGTPRITFYKAIRTG